ncbi:hypothetical protein [Ohtaekwangia sp.]|uniref:hypothetical protein n=1 Tax=Ohtaekwangia sp. TaxID=2066019 RepID=UPI002F948171
MMKRKITILIPLGICLIASAISWVLIVTGITGEKETWRVIFSSAGLLGILFLTLWLGKRIYKKA